MAVGQALINARELLTIIGLRQGECVADFGCGRSGHIAFPASWMVGEDGQVYAVDINKQVLDQLAGAAPHARATNVTTTWGDVEAPGGSRVPESSVDHVFCVNNLWCMNDYEAVLQEMQRILRRGGQGYLVDWHKNTRHPVAPPIHDRARVEDVEWFLGEMGVDHERFYVSPHHWGLRLKFS